MRLAAYAPDPVTQSLPLPLPCGRAAGRSRPWPHAEAVSDTKSEEGEQDGAATLWA
jgi:hypothetical protein